jgi:hypothetical protein
MRRHRPFDVVDTRSGWHVVSRTGRYRRWSPAMARGLARLRQCRPDTREMML